MSLDLSISANFVYRIDAVPRTTFIIQFRNYAEGFDDDWYQGLTFHAIVIQLLFSFFDHFTVRKSFFFFGSVVHLVNLGGMEVFEV